MNDAKFVVFLRRKDASRGTSLMIASSDEELARILQEEEELSLIAEVTNGGAPSAPFGESDLLDPTPDLHALFRHFNDVYFEGKLGGVGVEWSTRMTLCAGQCRYEGRGGLCRIGISEPLLKFRPRSDLVDTLLHEMIHAFLFVAERNRDHDDHGEQFQYHMRRVNAQAGTRISIYHNFRDEVDLYRVHWWQCQGKCQRIVKRAMNRAPGAYDNWWAQHLKECGGEYVKIKEPPPKEKPSKKRKQTDTTNKTKAKDKPKEKSKEKEKEREKEIILNKESEKESKRSKGDTGGSLMKWLQKPPTSLESPNVRALPPSAKSATKAPPTVISLLDDDEDDEEEDTPLINRRLVESSVASNISASLHSHSPTTGFDFDFEPPTSPTPAPSQSPLLCSIPPPPAFPSSPSASTSSSPRCTLQFRMAGEPPFTNEFRASEPLSAVYQFLRTKFSGRFSHPPRLATNFPKHTFTPEENSMTLSQLHLPPRSVLWLEL